MDEGKGVGEIEGGERGEGIPSDSTTPPVIPPTTGNRPIEGEEIAEGVPIPEESSSDDYILLFGKFKVRKCIGLTEGNDRCTNPALKGNSYCKHHNTSLASDLNNSLDPTFTRKIISLPSDFSKEIRGLRKFLIDLTTITDTPKVLNRVNDLIEVVERMETKIKGNVTKQQIQQLGFYFASILFKYIPDGQRYEEAKREFIDAVLKAGAYNQTELDDVIKSSSEVRHYESI